MVDDANNVVPAEYQAFAALVQSGQNISPAIDALFDTWEGRYTPSPPAALTVVPVAEGEILYDRSGPSAESEPRTVGVAAFLERPAHKRDLTYQSAFPMAMRKFGRTIDRGHLLPHTGGGEFGPNIYPQDRNLNRGWSLEGKKYRQLETKAALAGAFFFCALLYCDETDFPAVVELGLVIRGKLEIRSFRNRFDEAALAKFPLPKDPSDALRALLSSLTNWQLGDIGEECIVDFLESEFDAAIVGMGDSHIERTERKQKLDAVALIDGDLIAVEVKTRFQSKTAGTTDKAGNLPKPRMNRKSRANSVDRRNAQGTPGYAADRLEDVLPDPNDGTIATWCVAVDLKSMLTQAFQVDERGRVGKPIRPPVDCTQAVRSGIERIMGHRGHL